MNKFAHSTVNVGKILEMCPNTKKTVAISQSNYIPWKGYFDLINLADEFILLDSVQYTKNDWRNRNQIKSPSGLLWLTIPVHTPNRQSMLIQDVSVSHSKWIRKHWNSIAQNYAKTLYFKDYKTFFEEMYFSISTEQLSAINHHFIVAICDLLNIKTKLSWSTEYQTSSDRNQRLIDICQQLGATHYLSGPAAKSYLDEALFNQAGIQVCYMNYSGYREYPQFHPPFEHGVSILDLILNTGPDAPQYMKSFIAE